MAEIKRQLYKKRSEEELRNSLQRMIDHIWGRPKDNKALFTIPVDDEKDVDCILSDGIAELMALRAENKRLHKALDLACEDIADDSCPAAIFDASEFSGWDECVEFPAQEGELHVDTERDVACLKRYYLEKALEVSDCEG